MAIYHLEAKVVSRGEGRSACAASAYLSCSAIYNDYDGIQHDYTRKHGLVWESVFLSEHAPVEWYDREALWNAVEEAESTKDSRLAREFVAALPIELDPEQWRKLMTDFIQHEFVSDGMCADLAIHDPYPPGHNPHAHILLTVRPLDENGKWQYKTKKEYVCVRNGEEQAFTADEFKTAKAEGWEKQYPYKVARKKEYMTAVAGKARGLTRVSKDPKSTKYGRQNPITERWNSEEQLILWRAAWADHVNHFLEQAGRSERVDHRSFAEQGMDAQPTIHEGIAARIMESKGIVSERCEINRQIRQDNVLLAELKDLVDRLIKAVQNTIPALAEAMERLRQKILILSYQLLHIGKVRASIRDNLKPVQEAYDRYREIRSELKNLSSEKKELTARKKSLSPFQIGESRRIASRIAEITEDMEELRSEKKMILLRFDKEDADMKAVKDWIKDQDNALQKAKEAEDRFQSELDSALSEFHDLEKRAAELNQEGLTAARLDLRDNMDYETMKRIQDAYGKKYDYDLLKQSEKKTAELLHEKPLSEKEISIRKRLQEKEQIIPHGQPHLTRSAHEQEL